MAENDDKIEDSDCMFQWDESAQLYYHASTGFYHDPQAGWYYSTRDGLYYKFEDGNYVLLESNKAVDVPETDDANTHSETSNCQMILQQVQDQPFLDSSKHESGCRSDYPPPTSEWLEDTLIDIFLSSNSNRTTQSSASDVHMLKGTAELRAPEHEDDDSQELEEGEWIPDDPDFWENFCDKIMKEGISKEEELWRAQYGEVSHSDEEWMAGLQAVDLWDWALVRGTRKDGKTQVNRLVGRLAKPSAKLHPSVPSGSKILKTAPICEVHINMVRVASGRVYRLKTPSLKHLALVPAYDASNPTKDWGFPELSTKNDTEVLPSKDQPAELENTEVLQIQDDKSSLATKPRPCKKDHKYRDRAAERRALHGGFGIGPGQKHELGSTSSAPSSPPTHPEEAAAESMSILFGTGSYARKLLESMGWKEGESLGSSMKGLTEPLRATGNKGTSGLGWEDKRYKG